MPVDILLMIAAFLCGGLFQYLSSRSAQFSASWAETSLRPLIYKTVVIYLLFKIGFTGGKSVITQPLEETLTAAAIMIAASVVWTLFILRVLRTWSPFNRVTQISIAAHFGSVSVGTFIAGLAFLEALDITVPGSVAIWLALMELPAICVGMWQLGLSFKSLLTILKKDFSLLVLMGAIVWGMVGASYTPSAVLYVLSGTVFLVILTYFLFEMGRKALAAVPQIKQQLKATLTAGILLPLIGGLAGTSLGFLLGYNLGEIFVVALLLASASYVLAPISMEEILKSLGPKYAKMATQAISTSMALSVGAALPFNIIFGFEIYYLHLKALQQIPSLAWVGLALPVIIYLAAVVMGRSQKN